MHVTAGIFTDRLQVRDYTELQSQRVAAWDKIPQLDIPREKNIVSEDDIVNASKSSIGCV